MIAVSCDVQLVGLGRVWSTAVDHNNIYLMCPVTKSNHAFRVGSGFTSLVVGNYINAVPVVVAKECEDEDGTKHIEFKTTSELSINTFGDYARKTSEGWSSDLALKATPTLCMKVVSMILSGKGKDDFYKVLADSGLQERITIKRLNTTGQYEIELDGKSVDLEHILNVIQEVETARIGLIFNWDAVGYEDILDENEHYLRTYFGKE